MVVTKKVYTFVYLHVRACAKCNTGTKYNIKTYSNEEFMEDDACYARYVGRSSM